MKIEMNILANICKVFFASLGGILGDAVGGFDSLFYALVAFVTLDYVTGVLLAVYNKKLSSAIGFRGINKKVLIFLIIATGSIIDQYVIKSGNTLRTLLIMFYLSNEGLSIIENTGKMGVPLPKKLKDTIEKLSDEEDS